MYEAQSSFHGGDASRIIQGVGKAAWKPSARATCCSTCVKKFGLLRRKHHCRACGDICCRRCMGFCLVDVPLLGIDISYTCIRCIRQHNSKPSLVDDLAHLAQSIDHHMGTRVVRAGTATTTCSTLPSPSPSPSLQPTLLHASPRTPSSFLLQPASPIPITSSALASASANASPSPSRSSRYEGPEPPTSPRGGSLSSALTPCDAPQQWELNYHVIVSQHHNQRLHSVCSLLGDYLECQGGAVVLMEDVHVWVLAHKGLHMSTLHSPSFLALCQQSVSSKEAVLNSLSTARKLSATSSICSLTASSAERKKNGDHLDDFRFVGVSPIFRRDQKFSPLGCLIALDGQPRSTSAATRVEKTLETLARLVANLLENEQNILRLYTSGDFKIFASSAMDVTCAPRSSPTPTFDAARPFPCSTRGRPPPMRSIPRPRPLTPCSMSPGLYSPSRSQTIMENPTNYQPRRSQSFDFGDESRTADGDFFSNPRHAEVTPKCTHVVANKKMGPKLAGRPRMLGGKACVRDRSYSPASSITETAPAERSSSHNQEYLKAA